MHQLKSLKNSFNPREKDREREREREREWELVRPLIIQDMSYQCKKNDKNMKKGKKNQILQEKGVPAK